MEADWPQRSFRSESVQLSSEPLWREKAFMRVNAKMADLLAGFEVDVREEHVPDQFRAVVQRGWTRNPGSRT